MADGISFRTMPHMERVTALPRAAGIAQPMMTNMAASGAALRAMELLDRNPNGLRELAVRDDVRVRFPGFLPPAMMPPGMMPPRMPPMTPPPTLAPPISPVAPVLSADNPFQQLPQPNPGDRIRSDDFRVYSRCLAAMQNACMLSASLFGRTLAEARPFIAAQQYTVEQVMSVFGALLTGAADPSLEQRRIVQLSPVAFGERRLLVVVSEAVETRRLTPNLMNLTYADANERIRAAVGDATFPQMSVRVGQLVGATLGDASRAAVTTNG